MATYAYIRVSTDSKKQTTDNQRKEILDEGFTVDEWFSEDGVSGSMKATSRPAFSAMMQKATKGDTVITVKIDRLGRSACDILNIVDTFKQMGVKLRIIQFDSVDMTSSVGKLLITVMAAMCELEKDLLVERIHSGLSRAEDEGKVFGPPLKLSPDTLDSLCADKVEGHTYDMLATKYNLQRTLIARNVSRWKDDLAGYREEYIKREEQYKQSEIERLRRKKAA